LRKDWLRRPGTLCALGSFLLALVVYARTMAPTISFWDCGEYITTAHILGVPHQPGTPLYVIMGRFFDLLLAPLLSTAVAINFMSAFFSALGVMLTYLVIADLARRADADSGWLAHAGGLVGACFLLFSDTYWNNAIEAEVYGLAGFMVALLAWLALRWYDARREKRSDWIYWLILYLLGLGVGFHLGTLLVYPAIFLLAILARERRVPAYDLCLASGVLALFLLSTITTHNTLLIVLTVGYAALVLVRAFAGHRFALVGAALVALGISVHLFLLIRAGLDPAINQSQPDDLGTLMQVLRREQYPPLNPFERSAPLRWQFGYYYGFLVRQFAFLGQDAGTLARLATFLGPLLLGFLGLFHGIRRARPWIWMLVAGYLINAEVLTLYLNFTDHEVRERDYFYSAGFMFYAMLIGLGAAALLRYAAGPEGKSARDLPAGATTAPVRANLVTRLAAAVLLAIALAPLVPGHPKWFTHDRSDNWIAREYAWNMLAGLDRDAILFTNGDNDTFPIWYLQEVERFRRDVTVVNLSLVNLPWYVRQLRDRPPGLQVTYTDAQLDQLQARIYEDPRTGERQIVYVRDWVVHDILTANNKAARPRAAFFAVTIPQENMAIYYPFLRMEGLAFRLTQERHPEDQPGVDAERTLQNMLGVYDYTSLLDGDSRTRWAAFRAQVGLSGEPGEGPQSLPPGADMPLERVSRVDYGPLIALVGHNRTDVYRDRNTTNLLGNYPVAAWRAGADMIMQAQAAAYDDTARYDWTIDRATVGMDLTHRFQPFFGPIVNLFPLLLVEQGRTEEALAYLASLRGNVTEAEEVDALSKTLLSLGGAGRAAQAQAWLEERIAAHPRVVGYYRVLFGMHRAQGDLAGCREVAARWRQVAGADDPELKQALDRLPAAPPAGAPSPPGAPGGGAG